MNELLKSKMINNELKIGDTCYHEHNKYIYKGENDDGKHVVEAKGRDSVFTKYLTDKPSLPELPMGLYLKEKRSGHIGEVISCFHMNGEMFYRINVYSNVFKETEQENMRRLMKNYEVVEGEPFQDEETINEQLEELDYEAQPWLNKIKRLEEEIKELKENELKPIEEEREKIYKTCKHDWYKHEEDDLGGNRFEQLCECQKCGQEKYNRYSRLF